MDRTRTTTRQTVEDFMKLPEGTLAELIDGEIFVSPSPKVRHQMAVGRLNRLLGAFAESRGLGHVFVAPLDVHLPSGDIVEPDIIFVAAANAGIIQDWIRGVPDLLIEVLSEHNPRHDRVLKRSLYARNGVAEYWIVDVADQVVEVLALAGDAFELHGRFGPGDTVSSRVLADLALPAAKVFQ
jgi:Uma2 family endonuclease